MNVAPKGSLWEIMNVEPVPPRRDPPKESRGPLGPACHAFSVGAVLCPEGIPLGNYELEL